MIVAGADGCRDGWVVVYGRALGSRVKPTGARVVRALGEIAEHEEAAVLAIDIPIGLPRYAEPGGRACDRAARALLGARRASVFSPPVRAVLACATYGEALRASRGSSAHGLGLSKQTWHLVPKIREAEGFAATGAVRTVEAHPELIFRTMTGAPMAHPKRTPAGRSERACVLERAIGAVPRSPGGHAPDDLLDACACLWTAWRFATGRALCVPADAGAGEPVIWA